MAECAMLTRCALGKIHTTRSALGPSATVCAVGERSCVSAEIFSGGAIWLVDTVQKSPLVSCNLAVLEPLVRGRERVAGSVLGPKKDVSGDGLGGCLCQLALRHR